MFQQFCQEKNCPKIFTELRTIYSNPRGLAMKITKEQIKKIIQEELARGWLRACTTQGHGQCFCNARKSYGHYFSNATRRASPASTKPNDANGIPTFNGYGQILNEAPDCHRKFLNTQTSQCLLVLEQSPCGLLS